MDSIEKANIDGIKHIPLFLEFFGCLGLIAAFASTFRENSTDFFLFFLFSFILFNVSLCLRQIIKYLLSQQKRIELLESNVSEVKADSTPVAE